MDKKIIVVEACNYIDYPTGGQLTFAKHFIKTFKNNVLLVGITTDPKITIGQWTKIDIEGTLYDFLPLLYRKNKTKKPIIPGRFQWVVALLINLNKLKKVDTNYFFTQDISSLFPINKIKNSKILHNSAGLNNPFINPRYKWSKFLKKPFKKIWYNELSKTHLLMAAADQDTINLLKQSTYKLKNKTIYAFPTRFDDKVFFPKDKFKARRKLNIPDDIKMIVTSGRINKGKGWELLIEVAKILQNKRPNHIIFWLGDGEDRSKMDEAIKSNEIENLIVVGNVSHQLLSEYLSAADLFILASYREGWSTSIVEALACGKNVVTTNVSSAAEMIENNNNGFIVYDRTPETFAQKILEALSLPDPNENSIKKVDTFKLSNLKSEFLKIWQQSKNL